MNELADMMKDEPRHEWISDKLLERAVQERNVKLIINNDIYNYTRKHHIHLWEVTRKDLEKISENYPARYQQLCMKQFMQILRTNRGKPLKWIKENHKSILLDEID